MAFPDPASVATVIKGIKFLRLSTLVELKIASGMTAPHRLKDLSDVIEVIRLLKLPETFAEELNPYVRGKYLELWNAVKAAGDTPTAP